MDESEPQIILPGSEEFDETLALALPTGWYEFACRHSGNYGFVVDSESGLVRVESLTGVREYVEGGEYDERLKQVEDLQE